MSKIEYEKDRLRFLSDAEIVENLRTVGIGSVFRCSPSALLRNEPISHCTEAKNEERTLCGRACDTWFVAPAFQGGPDCLACRRKWEDLGADALVAPVEDK